MTLNSGRPAGGEAAGLARRPGRPRPGDSPSPRSPAASRRRADDIELLGFREDVRGRWRMPLLFALILLVAGATRFEESRNLLAEVVTVAAPVAVMTIAVAPLREALPSLRNSAFATAGGVALLAEAILVPHVLGRDPTPGAAILVPLAALATALVPIEVLAVRRGFSLRPAALGGMVTVFALDLPTFSAAADPLGACLAAGTVAVFLGGGGGFVAGMIARSVVGVRA